MPFEQETQRAKEAKTEEVRAERVATEPVQVLGSKHPKRRQSKQTKQAPPGAMWFVPGQTETAVKKSKIQDSQNPENVTGKVNEGCEGTAESSQDVGDVGDVADAKEETIEAPVLDDPWQTLEENRQLAWAFAEESPLEKVDVWDQAPDASFKALAWEELEKVETELSKLKEEDGIGLHEDEDEEAILTAESQELPIEALRTEILERVRNHRATILVGATGCGKSTQLPRYIMEEPGASVLVTQPRRVAAVEIAKRVAAERGERIGKNVGYRISGEIVEGNGKLQFATIGREWAGYGNMERGWGWHATLCGHAAYNRIAITTVCVPRWILFFASGLDLHLLFAELAGSELYWAQMVFFRRVCFLCERRCNVQNHFSFKCFKTKHTGVYGSHVC